MPKRRQGSQGFVYYSAAFTGLAAAMVTASASLLSSPYCHCYGKNGCCYYMNCWISIRQQCLLLSSAQPAKVYKRYLQTMSEGSIYAGHITKVPY